MKEKKIKKPDTVPAGKYKKGRGGRKTATAQVRIYPGGSGFVVNNKDYKEYFPYERQQQALMAPLEVADMTKAVGVTVVVKGSGVNGQAEAIRQGLAQAIAAHDPELRKKLKREGFLKRDPRAVERKKYGLKKARRAPQWSKR
ncbi:MAG: 30S ribosomal protein S9 [Candidatus Harrisonbacteria bacterium CG10_big_fil_rev_8_21_14_0_10_49_15]|uniref:Small ribosomal subunit protein uS9 n=1 Tax=Candidatus Harrisonbacteria bacterium CG10_big_fil_rev_8_21_14_0_10_49_15 TaxID=1974587 RepID=A0A2H0UJT0_9BACT|nr:MAG: 30S ribosomal protein S9 [Candidatus Harrisonbacteria bacterium CG10_big_fil_rev_8_21_14_0_10_49_15]